MCFVRSAEERSSGKVKTDIDQWKSDGDCDRCRRQEYCKTECKAHRERVKDMQNALFNQIMARFMQENNMFRDAEAAGHDPLDLLGSGTDAEGGRWDADGAGKVSAGLGEDCRGEEGVSRVEMREVREAVQEAGRGVRHAQEHADGSASEP